jgi:hypothetical protein
MLKAKRIRLREKLRRLSQYREVEINGFVFKRMANGIVVTLPDSHLRVSSCPNMVWNILLRPKEAIKKMWQLMLIREDYTRHDLFWEKISNVAV